MFPVIFVVSWRQFIVKFVRCKGLTGVIWNDKQGPIILLERQSLLYLCYFANTQPWTKYLLSDTWWTFPALLAKHSIISLLRYLTNCALFVDNTNVNITLQEWKIFPVGGGSWHVVSLRWMVMTLLLIIRSAMRKRNGIFTSNTDPYNRIGITNNGANPFPSMIMIVIYCHVTDAQLFNIYHKQQFRKCICS